MKIIILAITIFIINISTALAGDGPITLESNKNAIDLVQTHADYLWTLVAAALVFFMQAGFAMVEAGFTRAKNAINIMMKNLMDFSMGSPGLLGRWFRPDVRGFQIPDGSEPPGFS